MNTATISTIALWEQRQEEARKHAVSRVVQLYLDKRYFVAIKSTGHSGKLQDFIKEAILNEGQRRFEKACAATLPNESDKERADRLQSELVAAEIKLNDTDAKLIATETKLNDLLQAMQKVCSNISI